MQLKLSHSAKIGLDKLDQAGFPAYIVGGCVRDLLMGKEPADWDIATKARPEAIKTVFSDFRCIDTGLKHGTVTVIIDGTPLEITTFRTESIYSDKRHPDQVCFCDDIKQDLARRDFTINAMAYNQKNGLIDYWGGQADLAAGYLRAVGLPEQRFQEDALRILRALRFAASLNLKIEEKTEQAIFAAAANLSCVSAERIKIEFTKLLCGEQAVAVIRRYYQIIGVFIPELLPMVGMEQHNPYHAYTVFEHTMHALLATPPDPILRWTVFLHDFGKPQTFTMDKDGVGHFYGHPSIGENIAVTIMERLKFSNAEISAIRPLIRYHDIRIKSDQLNVKRWLRRLGVETFERLIAVKWADISGQNPNKLNRLEDIKIMRQVFEQILAEKQCFQMSDLLINGSDILALGCPAGPMVGNVLNWLLEQVIADKLPNQHEALIQAAKKFLALPEIKLNNNN